MKIHPNRLRGARHAAGLSQEQLADELGVTSKTVQRWERGYNQPSPTMITRLAERLGVTADYLYGLSEDVELDERLARIERTLDRILAILSPDEAGRPGRRAA